MVCTTGKPVPDLRYYARTKYAYALSQLETKYTLEIKDIITSPPESDRYIGMKTALIQSLATSQEQRTKQLLEHKEIGDRKPSQFLRHLKALAGNTVPDSLIRTLWLERLPSQMQVILATRKGDQLEKVAEQADRIYEVNGEAVMVASTTSRSKTEETVPLEEQVRRLAKQVATLTTQFKKGKRTRSRSRSRPRIQQTSKEDGPCYYHRRFKEKAQKCEKPCIFKQENSEGSH